jgi:hypothetical protein
MRLAVATNLDQGRRANDFCFCFDGELVILGIVCARDQADPDGGCGCGRAFSGLSSHKATTTAVVREVDLTYDDLVLAVQSYLEQSGWSAIGVDDDSARALAEEMVDLGQQFDEGTFLERRLDDVRPRL